MGFISFMGEGLTFRLGGLVGLGGVTFNFGLLSFTGELEGFGYIGDIFREKGGVWIDRVVVVRERVSSDWVGVGVSRGRVVLGLGVGAVIVGVVSPVVSEYDGDGGIHGSAQSDFSGFVVVGVDLPVVVVVVVWDGDGGGDGDGGTHGSAHRDALDVSSRYGDDGGDGDGGTHGSAHRDTLDGVVFSFADATIASQSISIGGSGGVWAAVYAGYLARHSSSLCHSSGWFC